MKPLRKLRLFLLRLIRHRKPIAIFIGAEGDDPEPLYTWRDVIEKEHHNSEDQIIYFRHWIRSELDCFKD